MYQHQHIMSENLDSLPTRQVPLWFCRLLVIVLTLSFVAFLVTLWLSGTLTSIPDQWSSITFIQFLGAHRLPALALPVVCLVVCYFALRHLTGEILAVPERYLDERQRMVRDQAHRSAFKLIKASCVLLPLVLVLVKLPSWLQPAPAPTPLLLYTIAFSVSRSPLSQIVSSSQQFPLRLMVHYVNFLPVIPSPTPTEIILSACLLLLSLFLVASALPMFVLAWKGKM